MEKTALITGITGQDGPYLAALLLEKGYRVHGMRQPVAVPDLGRIERVLGSFGDTGRFFLHYGDLGDAGSVMRLVSAIQPDEIYNLAAQSHVHISFDVPEMTAQINAVGVLRLLESIRILGFEKKTRFFQASTSELFGNAAPPQSEITPMNPRSPYAAAKQYAFQMVRIYREAYGLYACNGIMFNHEGPLRGEEFVTRKICRAVARIVAGEQKCLRLGNLEAKRDWSHVRDIVRGMHAAMGQDRPADFVFASGDAHTVREFATEAFRVAGFSLGWQGQGMEEKAIDRATGQVVVRVDPELFRPLEVENLVGDPSQAWKKLGWRTETSFPDLVREMVDAETASLKNPESDPVLVRLYA